MARLAGDLPRLKGFVSFSTGNNFPWAWQLLVFNPATHERSRVCDSGIIVGRTAVSIPDPCLSAAGFFSERVII